MTEVADALSAVADYLGRVKADLDVGRLDHDQIHARLAATIIERGEVLPPADRGRVAAALRRIARRRRPAKRSGRRNPLRDVQIVVAVSLAHQHGASLSRSGSSAFSIVAEALCKFDHPMSAVNVQKIWEKHDFKLMPK